MKKYHFVLFFTCVLFTGCLSMTVYTDADQTTNFSSFKKYAWAPQKFIHQHKDQKFDNDIIESRIHLSVMNELNARGFVLDTANPDIFLDYDIMTEKKMKQEDQPVYASGPVYYPRFNNYNRYYYGNNYYHYGGWNNYYSGNYTSIVGYKTINIPYQEGTLILDIVDVKANRLVWKGYAVGEVDDPMSFEFEIGADIHKMFKSFPVRIPKK